MIDMLSDVLNTVALKGAFYFRSACVVMTATGIVNYHCTFHPNMKDVIAVTTAGDAKR